MLEARCLGVCDDSDRLDMDYQYQQITAKLMEENKVHKFFCNSSFIIKTMEWVRSLFAS